MILVTRHQPRAQKERHGLEQGQLERRQKRGLLRAVAPAVLPDCHPHLFFERAEVAVDLVVTIVMILFPFAAYPLVGVSALVVICISTVILLLFSLEWRRTLAREG